MCVVLCIFYSVVLCELLCDYVCMMRIATGSAELAGKYVARAVLQQRKSLSLLHLHHVHLRKPFGWRTTAGISSSRIKKQQEQQGQQQRQQQQPNPTQDIDEHQQQKNYQQQQQQQQQQQRRRQQYHEKTKIHPPAKTEKSVTSRSSSNINSSINSSSSISSINNKNNSSNKINRKTPLVQSRAACKNPLLARDFIATSLYNQDTGYFATKDVINDLPGPLDFGSMMGEMHYRMDVKQAYESKLSAWMTPVETFSPHFSHALARFIAREAKTAARALRSGSNSGGGGGHKRGAAAGRMAENLVLYEAGGGTGTNALNVLNWLRREEPRLYERTEYTIVEISERLAERQTERVCAVHENCRVVNSNVLEWGMSGEVDSRPCFFMGLELLDNLPHDKIAWTTPTLGGNGDFLPQSPGRKSSSATVEMLCEAVVLETPSGGFREAFRPLRDPAILELLTLCPELALMVKNPKEYYATKTGYAVNEGTPSGAAREGGLSSFSSGSLGKAFKELFRDAGGLLRPEHRAAFVPTGSLRLVQALRRRLPRHRAVLADFDSFDGSSNSATELSRVTKNGDLLEGEMEDEEGIRSNEYLTAFQAPIVSSRNPATGNVTDHPTYMVPLGSADIFFPTCFERLSRMHSMVCSRDGIGSGAGGGAGGIRRGRGLVVKQREFLREFADLNATRTFSGFNPLLDDFQNSSMFLSGVVAP